MSVFLDGINMWIKKLSKTDCPLRSGWASSIQLKANRTKRLRKREFLLPECLGLDSSLFLLSDSNWNTSSSWVLSLPAFGLELTPLALLVLKSLDLDRSYAIYFPRSPIYQLPILGLLSLHNHMNQFFIISLWIYCCTYFTEKYIPWSGMYWQALKNALTINKAFWEPTDSEAGRSITGREGKSISGIYIPAPFHHRRRLM